MKKAYTAKEIFDRMLYLRDNPDAPHGDFVAFGTEKTALKRSEELKQYGVESYVRKKMLFLKDV
jgi:hypothetical protein